MLETQILVDNAVKIRENLHTIAAQVREYAVICGGTDSTFAYSHGLAHQLLQLTVVVFPEVQGKIYQKIIAGANTDTDLAPGSMPQPKDCSIVLLDYGMELYHYADRGRSLDNMQPTASALAHMLTAQPNGLYFIKSDSAREQLSTLLYEPARCFYIALGEATNKNPIILQKAFRTMIIEMASLQPQALQIGSPIRDPLLSLLEYGRYVDHHVLSIIFPECLEDTGSFATHAHGDRVTFTT